MEKLREVCIPKITLLLHSVMSEMNEHAECIQLADILASEQYQLYKVHVIFINKIYIIRYLFIRYYYQNINANLNCL